MLRRSLTVCSMTALLLGGTAAAQSPGTLLVGGFGQYQYFNDQGRENNFEFDRLGIGARVGAYITPQLNLEADGMWAQIARSEGARDEDYSAIAARLMYSFPLGNMPSFHIGAGGVLKNIKFDEPPHGGTYNFGVEGAAGVNLGFGGFALRFDVLGDYFPEPSEFDVRVQAGVQFSPDLGAMFGGGGMTTSSSTLWAPIVWWDVMDAPLPGTVEIGAFGQWTMFDENAGRPGSEPKDGLGYGGRVGVFLSDPRWQVEGDGYYSPHDNDAEPIPAGGADDINAHAFALRVNYNFPLGNLMGRQSQFIIGAGPVRTSYKFKGPGSAPDTYNYNYGASGLVGLRLGVANRVAIRIDGVIDYMPNHEPDANMNLHARAGLSLLLGGGRPEAMCPHPGLESIPASSPNCVAPPPPPPPPPPPAPCPFDASIPATDPRCVAPVAAVDTTAITGPIYFDFDKSTIRPDAAATLDRKIPWLQANPGMRIRIEGNADERGSDEYNLALGQRRAASAKRYLVERGIAADRFDLVSYGEERPVCTEHNEACWQQNRRDDFRIVTIGGDGVIRVP
jgi:peptidoglycan-associated lipoprotein